MTRQSMRMASAAGLAVLLTGASVTLLADDAKKRELALAKCAATYRTDLTECERAAEAEACYRKADATDRACREAQGAVGNSDVEISFVNKRREIIALGPRQPLGCGTGLEATCADGHARFPICAQSSQQRIQEGQGIGGNEAVLTQDAQGDKDVCSGQTLRCPAGFTLVPRRGQDLCWDSLANRKKYIY